MGRYQRPTVAQVRKLEARLRAAQSFAWLEGFRSGCRAQSGADHDFVDAAYESVRRSFAERAKLHRQVRDLSNEVFIRNHDGVHPLHPTASFGEAPYGGEAPPSKNIATP